MLAKSEEPMIQVDNVVKFQYEDVKKLRMVIFFQLATIAALIFFIITDWSNKPKPIYFYVNKNNQLINPIPLNKAGISNASLLNWYSEAIMNAYSFNYKNKNTKISKLKSYFTENGFNKFKTTIDEDVMFSGIEENKLISSMRVLEAPEILQDGIVKGVYTWNIKLPVIVFLQNEASRRSLRLDIETIVIRVPEITSPMGILIDDFTIIHSSAIELAPNTPGRRNNIPAGGAL